MGSLMILIGWLLDVLSLKGLSDAIFTRFATPGDPDYPVHRAVWGLLSIGEVEKAFVLSRGRWERSRSPRSGRDYIHVLLRRREFSEAEKVAAELAERNPKSAWIRVLYADIVRFFSDPENPERALEIYGQADPLCTAMLPDHYPLSVLLKRVTRIHRERGDEEALLETLERFLSLKSTNFHHDEFILLAELHLKRGNRERAREVLETGCQAKVRDVHLRDAWRRMGFGDPPPIPPRKKALPDLSGFEKIPIKTKLLTEADDPAGTVKSYVEGDLKPGDVVAFSSCVAAIMEGRMLMEGTVPISRLARFTSRLIAGRHPVGGFTSSAPMANALSAQTALEEVGTLRILAAIVAGGIGKMLGRDGWFYVVAGPQVAQIDDILGSLPPYDYYVMLGPNDPYLLSNRIAKELGQGVGAAIVDANDLGIAWAVGYSDGVDAKALETGMADNPAGNQDQMTPIVVVRRAAEGKAGLLAGSQ
jgi:hypothetical protein